ncbi:penicillin acylase family protein [Oleisolibacter albus]|uniref:penicillin acylase family protein n=1 Tax=Oleisolibacter albus TaxID=2171757 RepID=UPI001390572D|nr:penicillin acylase family protein [Oleisolibacter albus]
MGSRTGRIGRRVAKGAVYTLAGVLGVGLVAGAAFTLVLLRGEPRLEGAVTTAGLSAPVTILRDVAGVPTLRGQSRADLARALGFLHGQERFFQMDLMRRSAAGELSDLVGSAALPLDRARRLHRMRARSAEAVKAMDAQERALLEAYVQGVNAGLRDLSARPFEYALLLQAPRPWTAEDTILAVYALYFDLQDSSGDLERAFDQAVRRVGPEMAAALLPSGTAWDSALDGSLLPEPPLPDRLPGRQPAAPAAGGAAGSAAEPAPVKGSNAWAVGGALTDSGAALVANDMHLGLPVPATWYRARLILHPDGAAAPTLDITGVTLPGTPAVVAGSNGHIAWGFTNSYIDTGDLVVLEPADGDRYRTPDGPKAIERVEERLCPAFADCETLVVENTIWGPVVGTGPDGARLAYRWTAHDTGAVDLGGFLGLEQAADVPAAIAVAHHAGIPQQNLVVGDGMGNVAWTIIGPVPARFGHDGRRPTSWADGTRGWLGMLPADEVPVILNPDDNRIWTANTRVVGGAAFAKLGNGGYDLGARAKGIQEALYAQDRFAPEDMLDIQLEDRAPVLEFWQQLLLAVLARQEEAGTAPAGWVAAVQDWGGRAAVDSVGYRLVRGFRAAVLQTLSSAYLGDLGRRPRTAQMEGAARHLLQSRPAGLVPPGHDSWDAVLDAALAGLAGDVQKAAGGDLEAFSWGARNQAGVRHPLARLLPPVGWLTDPPDGPVPGDTVQPRAQAPGFGASERFAVSPGHEEEGYFHMPGGQSGYPLSPYYLAGHEDWVEGVPAPFLPGVPVWTLRLEPGR